MTSRHRRLAPLARRLGALAVAALAATGAHAGGGPFGIDHAVDAGDARGLWRRSNQLFLQDAAALVVVGSALWEGDGSRFGHASWQAVDALALGTVTAAGMKLAFSRARPTQGGPDEWFQGSGHNSFPSGEVMEITTAITPYVLEYGAEHPAVWALEVLPIYDAIARVRSRAHWQSDVLASFAIGTAIGVYAHSRPTSLSVGILPGGFTIGWKKRF